MKIFHSRPASAESRSAASQGMITLVVGIASAGATIAAVFIARGFQVEDSFCSDFNTHFERIVRINDSESKSRRLSELVTETGVTRCSSYIDAKQERDDIDKRIQISRTSNSDKGDMLEGVSAHIDGTDRGKPTSQPAGGTAISNLPVIPKPPAVIVETSTPAPPLDNSHTPIDSKFVATAETPPPVLTVTPHSTTFEGQPGAVLNLQRDVSYTLRPLQYYTTSYSVAGGDIIISVDGTPRFHCRPGNLFHLFWRNTPDFFAVTHHRSAALTVVDAQEGAHLGTSDCDPASG